MSTGIDWNWLIKICQTPQTEDINGEKIERNDWRFCPGLTGEPWISYQIASFILRIGVDSIRRKSTKTRKHPQFAGLILLTDFERFVSDGEET